MNKKVCIKIKGLHTMEELEDNDTVEVINVGTYYKRNGKHYVKYEGSDSSDSKKGYTLLKFSENELEVMSMDGMNTHMSFINGQKSLSYYNTPFGGINIGIETYDMNWVFEEDRIVMDIKYGLEVNLEPVSDCDVHIEVESAEE